jgi:glucuronokinase
MSSSSESESDLPEVVEESCFARVGLMGNPSDGFGGKTLSFLIENFKATVRIEARPRESGVEICEPVLFESLDDLAHHCTMIVSHK